MVAVAIWKTLLLVAAGLGILQGLITLIGCLVAANDSKNDDINVNRIYWADTKYACGFIQFYARGEFSDRGWFKRVWKAKKDGFPAPPYGYRPPDKDEIDKLAGYEAVTSYAVINGVCWIAAGVLAFLGCLKSNRLLILISAIVFSVFYCLHVALFGAIWDSVRKVRDKCMDNIPDDDATKQANKSSNEFLAYAILAFVFIAYCIAITFLHYFMVKPGEAPVGSQGAADASASAIKDKSTSNIVQKDKVADNAISPPPQKGEEKKETPAVPPLKDERKLKTQKTKGTELAEQFQKVNHLLGDMPKIETKAVQKFQQLDKDKGGKITHVELKQFVGGLMEAKKLPPPTDKRIAELLLKYDKDKSGMLDQAEFKEMYKDIYRNSREQLVVKYVKEKYKDFEKTKVASSDKKGAQELETLIKDVDKFYAELQVVAKAVDKDNSASLSIDEVTALAEVFCKKYDCPVFSKEEVTGILKDMQRDVVSLNKEDLKFIAYAILGLAKNIVLKP